MHIQPDQAEERFVKIEELEEWRKRQRGKYIWCEDCLATLPVDYAHSATHRDLHEER